MRKHRWPRQSPGQQGLATCLLCSHFFGGRGVGLETVIAAKPSEVVTGKQDIAGGQQRGSEEGAGLEPTRPGERNGNAFQDLEIGPAGPWERGVHPEPDTPYLDVNLRATAHVGTPSFGGGPGRPRPQIQMEGHKGEWRQAQGWGGHGLQPGLAGTAGPRREMERHRPPPPTPPPGLQAARPATLPIQTRQPSACQGHTPSSKPPHRDLTPTHGEA